MQDTPVSTVDGAATPGPLRIMVVDDDRDAVYTTCLLLKLKGYRAESALSGKSALERLESFSPDLVMLDLAMPDMGGLEVATSIREMALDTDPVLAAVSGHVAPEIQRQCAAAGFDHYLLKPVELAAVDQLIEMVRPLQPPRDFVAIRQKHKELSYQFIRSQLEFCALVMGALPHYRNEEARQKQTDRVHRRVVLSSAWLEKQPEMPTHIKRAMEETISTLTRALRS